MVRRSLFGLAGVVAMLALWFVIPTTTRQLWLERFEQELGRGHEDASGEASVASVYYTCPMHPQIRSSAPGKCPICGATLVKKKAGEGGRPGTVWLTDRQQQLSGVRFGEVRRRELSVEIATFGRIDYDERRVAYVSAWTGGRIDKLFVDFTGVTVQKGHPLLSIYSPELITAQREYLAALSATRGLPAGVGSARELVEGARQKLLWFGISEEQVRELEQTGHVGGHVTVNAPIGGTVVHKGIFEGQYVKTGEDLLRIADLSKVWLYADLYEQQIAPVLERRTGDYWTCAMHPQVHEAAPGACPVCGMPMRRASPGIRIRATTRAYPNEEFTGSIAFIDPFLQAGTRTMRVRADLDNPGLKLRPEMYAHIEIQADVGKLLSVPESAVLRGGERELVLLLDGPGTYRPVEVKLGLQFLRANGPSPSTSLPFAGSPERYHEVLSGLSEGDRVVTSANFLIGSEAQLQGALEKMAHASEAMSRAQTTAPVAVTAPAAGAMPGMEGMEGMAGSGSSRMPDGQAGAPTSVPPGKASTAPSPPSGGGPPVEAGSGSEHSGMKMPRPPTSPIGEER